MSTLVDRIADLIGLRDRDELDVALTRLTWELLGVGVKCVAIMRPVGEEGDRRWLTRVRFRADQVAPCIHASGTAPQSLPGLADFPDHRDAIARGQILRCRNLAALALFPISAENEGLGVLEVETDLPLMPETEHLMSSLLRVYRNFHRLLDYGERDTLTDLLNRKTFDGVFLKATLPHTETELPFSGERRDLTALPRNWLGVIDIDHFKRVNDTFGHIIGDEVLILVARLMRSSFRFHDLIYRFGGEEFAVLVQCHHESEAATAFERFRKNAEQQGFPQVGHITVSIGLTALRPIDSPSSAFERADKALYHAKGHGRNQVCSHADLVASGEIIETDNNNSEIELF